MGYEKIEIVITRWFGDAQELIAMMSAKDKNTIIKFCAVATPVMKTYCRAIALLLEECFRLPAMALMRVTSEFFIKFLWCINSEDENEICNRLQKWDKTSGNKKLMLHNSALELKAGVLDKEIINKIENSKQKLEKELKYNTAVEMPRVTGKEGLFESTSNIFDGNISAVLYTQYCPAVHIDTSILSALIQKNSGQDLKISDDIDESLVELKKRCLNFAYMFLLSVYSKNQWSIESIEQEYKSMIDIL